MENVEGWPWLPDKCPPDMYFIEYMKTHPSEAKTILHQGPGLHHRVGIECCAMGHRVIGITISREEVVSRVFRLDVPDYQVFYANVNEVDTSLLPTLDIVTLFHFGEMPSMFGAAKEQHLQRLLDKMPLGGLMMFYNRSAEWGNSKWAVDSMVDLEKIVHEETFQELEIYQKV